jgi:glycosyltransferase involved in cell wall biosynthesis
MFTRYSNHKPPVCRQLSFCFQETLKFDVEDLNVCSGGFLNIALAQLPSRFIACMLALRKTLGNKPSAIIVYSAHLPLLLSAVTYKILSSNRVVILILPDLPEVMAVGSLLHRIAKKLEKFIFLTLMKQVDGFVLVSKHMTAALDLDEKIPSVVVEGIYNEQLEDSFSSDAKVGRYILYSGSLDRRYGMSDLLQAIKLVHDHSIELWVCGGGDGRDEIISAALTNSRIKYLGQLARNDVLALQRSALALVNPRRPEGLYTSLSFPSKTIEYMASGRPTIMHKLVGIPDEYFEHAIIPQTADSNGLAKVFNDLAMMTREEQALIGSKARGFILNSKSAVRQVSRILALIDRL